MRILFVSNLFPPDARGGYEQWCEEVAQSLAARGHQLCILTSRSHTGAAALADVAQPFPVHRLLQAEVEGGMGRTALRLLRGSAHVEATDLRSTQAVVQDFRPDAGLIWGMWNIAHAVPQRLEALLGDRLGYYFCDYWPTLPSAYVQRLQEPARHSSLQWGKAALARRFLPRLAVGAYVSLRFPNPICVSHAVRDILVDRGANLQNAQVIYGGTALAEAGTSPDTLPAKDAPLRLLYLGRLEPIKGVHTVIEAMRQLNGRQPGGSQPVTLDIVGSGATDYVQSLHKLVLESDLAAVVRFPGPVARNQVPAVMAEHNALVFPSEWEEPFARTLLEAMAAGLAVIGSTTGGTGEILVDGETGLTFRAGDSADLAGQIHRLAQAPDVRRSLAANGRALVRSRFTLQRMVDELEAALHRMAAEPIPTAMQTTLRRSGS